MNILSLQQADISLGVQLLDQIADPLHKIARKGTIGCKDYYAISVAINSIPVHEVSMQDIQTFNNILEQARALNYQTILIITPCREEKQE
jgi:hypothetical protein